MWEYLKSNLPVCTGWRKSIVEKMHIDFVSGYCYSLDNLQSCWNWGAGWGDRFELSQSKKSQCAPLSDLAAIEANLCFQMTCNFCLPSRFSDHPTALIQFTIFPEDIIIYFEDPLTCQKIMQDPLIVQVADFSEIDKRVGPNKAAQEGFFLIYVGKNQVLK